MNRREFMAQLARLLEGLPENERAEALRYYNDYFDEAGPENEAQVIQELGSPGKVAGIIRANLEDGGGRGEFTEQGYREEAGERTPDYLSPKASQRRRGVGAWALLIILAVFALPVLLGVGGGLLGIVVGLAGGLLGLILACVVGGGGLLAGGIALFIQGILRLFHAPASAMISMGGGLLLAAVGILILLLFLWMAFTLVPRLIRAVLNFLSRVAHRGRGGRSR